MPSTLISKNVTIAGRRTSVRLEPYMWACLDDICGRENMTAHQFCTEVDRHRRASSLTAAIRVAILAYYRNAAVRRDDISASSSRERIREVMELRP